MSRISNKALAFGTLANKLKYNGKEEQRVELSDGTGLDLLDYGARMYDGQIGRLHVQDPLFEKYFGVTPYNYCLNNPISLFDFDGRDAIITIDFEKKTVTISSTIYFKGGTAEQRKEYIDAANSYIKDNSGLFSGKTEDEDGNEWGITVNLKYEDLGDKKVAEIGEGNNIANLDNVDEAGPTTASSGDKPKYELVNGKYQKTGVSKYNAGTRIDFKNDSKSSPGLVTVHETVHLLGLQDTYIKNARGESTGKNYDGYGKDIMSLGGGGKNNEINQYHWNSWSNYILSQPQVQQQQTQSSTQFILKYQVEIGAPAKIK